MKSSHPLLLAVLLAGCELKTGNVPASAPPPLSMKQCIGTGDCTLVDIDCNGCCGTGAVARADSAAYVKYRTRTCEGYTGGICDCYLIPAEAVCMNRVCTQVQF